MMQNYNKKETAIERMMNKEIPEYRNTMYLEGYTPEEILIAARKKMKKAYLLRQEERDESQAIAPMDVNINAEVKTK